VKLFETCGDVFKVDVSDNYIQTAVQRWDSPRTPAIATPVQRKAIHHRARSLAKSAVRRIKK
jgi:hypothetical protein